MELAAIFWLIGAAAFIALVQIAIQTADTARSLRLIEKRLLERDDQN